MAANDKPVTGDRVRATPDMISDYDLDNNRGPEEAAIVTERSEEVVGLARTRKEKPTLNFRFIHSFSQNTECILQNYAVKR
jgi:hypothetical protein